MYFDDATVTYSVGNRNIHQVVSRIDPITKIPATIPSAVSIGARKSTPEYDEGERIMIHS
jgi:hypothetical protein